MKHALLDPDHPAFSKMTKEQVVALEGMLKMSDEEIETLPPDQHKMVTQFRSVYQENPEVFRKRKTPAVVDPNKDKDKKETNKEDANDPQKWLKEHAKSSEWFQETHGKFDKEAFEEVENKKKEEEKKLANEVERMKQLRVQEEADSFMCGGVDVAVKAKKKVIKEKKIKKKKYSNEKKAELAELMGWAKGK